MMFPSLDVTKQITDPDRILMAHKSRIIQSSELMDEALPILSAIQRLTCYTLTNEKISDATLADILLAYKCACILLIADLKNKKSTIKLNLQGSGSIDKQSFLPALEKHEFADFKNLNDWNCLAESLAPYLIKLNSLEKFADLKGLIKHKSSLISNSQRASQARALITNILKEIPQEERKKLEDVPIGQKGLKSAVRERISTQQFRELFNSNNKDFQNRWSEVLKKQKSKD